MVTFDQFEKQALADGYNEVIERVWQPNEKLEPHTHPYGVHVMVVKGEMWMTCRGETKHVKVGDSFKLNADETHAELYGPQGTTFWVARLHPL